MGGKAIDLAALVLVGGLLLVTREYFADAAPGAEQLPGEAYMTATLEPDLAGHERLPEVP